MHQPGIIRQNSPGLPDQRSGLVDVEQSACIVDQRTHRAGNQFTAFPILFPAQQDDRPGKLLANFNDLFGRENFCVVFASDHHDDSWQSSAAD